MVNLINSLDSGTLRATSTSRVKQPEPTTMAAWRSVHAFVLKEAARFEKDCRGATPTGGHRDPSRDDQADDIYCKLPGVRSSVHVELRPDDIDEPPYDSTTVDMLTALPEEERRFYEDEHNVIEYSGKS